MIQQLVQTSIRLIPWRARNFVKRIPLVASLQRFVLARVLEGREFLHEIDAGPARGLIYPVILPDDKGVWTGMYELDFVEAISGAVRPGDVCFDVGGWRGYCGGVMAVQGASKVVVFEPLPGNSERIRRLISLNPNLPIELVQAAAGERDCQATFRVMEASSMGKLAESPFQHAASSSDTIAVQVYSLDSWCESNEVLFPTVIKIDVEGAEMLVLRGAKKILETTAPILFIEAHSRELTREVAGFLDSLQYRYRTLETGIAPDGKTEPEVCHLVAEPATRRN